MQVKVKLLGNTNDTDNIVEYETFGTLDVIGETTIVSYDEDNGDEGISGSSSKIGISNGLVTLNRVGKYTSTMMFIKNQYSKCDYLTPYGALQLNIFTRDTQVTTREDGIDIKLKYSLNVGEVDEINNLAITISYC